MLKFLWIVSCKNLWPWNPAATAVHRGSVARPLAQRMSWLLVKMQWCGIMSQGQQTSSVLATVQIFLQQHVMSKFEPHQNLSGCCFSTKWISTIRPLIAISVIKFRVTILEAVSCVLSSTCFQVLEDSLERQHRSTKISLRWLLGENKSSLSSTVGKTSEEF